MLREIITIAALALAGQGAARAQDRLPDITVRYGDLDLTKGADLRVFDRRLGWAVMSACPDERGIEGQRTARACRQAKRGEIAQLRSRALAAVAARNALAAAR